MSSQFVSLFSQKETEFIFFLSYLFMNTKIKYWSTELKIADIVWVIKKIYHMIKAAEYITIIYTDHSVTVFIIWQFSLNIIDIEKLNLQFIQTSEYLQQFHFDICYKSGKINIIFNTLSHLTSHNYRFKSDKLSLNILHISTLIFANILVEISFKFHKHIIVSYITESYWQCIIDIIKQNDVLSSKNAAMLFYVHI